jgi:hypothetical protein
MRDRHLTEVLHRIALQAGGSTYPDVNTAQLAGFGQRIVQECIDVAQQQGDNVEYLKQHFGVE